MQNFRKQCLCCQNIGKERKRSHTASGWLRKMLSHSSYLPICSCSMAIFNCSGIPIPGITARLLGSRSSRETQIFILQTFFFMLSFYLSGISHAFTIAIITYFTTSGPLFNPIQKLEDIKRTSD